jgi:Flp pilus assembly protein TadG
MRLADLARNRRGLAAIEFALLFPMMLLLFCGIVEAINLYRVDRKVVQAAQSCADLVTQEKTIDSAKLGDIGRAVELVLEPYSATGLSFRVSSVVYDAVDGTPKLGWQQSIRGFSAGSAPDPTSKAVGLGLAGESVIIVDLAYAYTPVFSKILPESFSIIELAAARPRRVRVIQCTAAGC